MGEGTEDHATRRDKVWWWSALLIFVLVVYALVSVSAPLHEEGTTDVPNTPRGIPVRPPRALTSNTTTPNLPPPPPPSTPTASPQPSSSVHPSPIPAWRQVEVVKARGGGPAPRQLSSLAYDDAFGLLLFGGKGRGPPTTALDDVWSLDLNDREPGTWVKRGSSEEGVLGPSARWGHSWATVRATAAARVGQVAPEMWMIGGESANGTLLGDVWALDTVANRWRRLPVMSPPSCTGHVALAVPTWGTTESGGVLVFGGDCIMPRPNATRAFSNNLWLIDIETKRWTLLQPEGTPPPARAWHAAVVLPPDTVTYNSSTSGNATITSSGRMLIIGGFNGSHHLGDVYEYDMDANIWFRWSFPTAPPPRSRHSAVAHGREVLVFGGTVKENIVADDLWLLNVDQKLWRPVPLPGSPSPRTGHSSTLRSSQMILFGGAKQDGNVTAEVWELDSTVAMRNPYRATGS